MNVVSSTAHPLPPPTTQPPPAPRASVPAPGLWAAAGLIVLYFLLQSAAGALISLVMALVAGFRHGRQGLGSAIQTMPGMQAVLVMFSLGVAALLTLWLTRWKWPQLWSLGRPPGFGFAPPRRPLFLVLALVAGLAAPLLGGLLTEWLAHGRAVTQNIQQLGANTPMGLRIPLVLLVISLGPLLEELLFRGVLLSALMQRWRTGWAVLISSSIFALVHLPGLQFGWYALPELALLAMVLAWLRLRSGSIWPAVLAHGVNNLLAVVAWFVVFNLPG